LKARCFVKADFGYCGMTADFLHIGHVNFLKSCREHCNKLIVGVMADECVEIYKGKRPLMNVIDRRAMIQSIRFVHCTIIQTEFEFPYVVSMLKIFYGDNFLIFDSEEHKRKGADIIIPRTNGISSTRIICEY
jgi:cytidyltransferase-like protein